MGVAISSDLKDEIDQNRKSSTDVIMGIANLYADNILEFYAMSGASLNADQKREKRAAVKNEFFKEFSLK